MPCGKSQCVWSCTRWREKAPPPTLLQLLLRSSAQGPLHGPSVLRVKRLDAVAHVVLKHRVSHRHAILAPLQPPFVDGLHRVDGPAGQVPAIKRRWAAIKVTAGSGGGAAADG